MISNTTIEFRRLSWDTFEHYCTDLFNQITSYLDETGEHIDLIVPLMREGGFVGLSIAYKLNTWKVLPLSSKKFEENGSYPIKLLAPIPKPLFALPEKPLVLIVDALTLSGKTVKWSREKLSELYPHARFMYASILQDYSTDIDKGFIKTFHCFLGDDKNTLSQEEADKRDIDKNIYLFPWQNEKEEIAGILRQNYEYY